MPPTPMDRPLQPRLAAPLWLPSRQEVAQLVVACLGVALDLAVGHRGLLFLTSCVLVGLLFEVACKPLWTFHDDVARSRYTVRGVNLFVALAWMGLISGGLVVTSWLEQSSGWPRVVSLAVTFGVLGNVVESLFAATGALRYHLNHPLLAFPFERAPLVLGVPLAIRAGYFTSIPALAWLLSNVP